MARTASRNVQLPKLRIPKYEVPLCKAHSIFDIGNEIEAC